MNGLRIACCALAGSLWPVVAMWAMVICKGLGNQLSQHETNLLYLMAAVAIAATLTALCVKDTPK